jgi:hemerythrin
MTANELFRWSDDHSVNIQAIDEQHKMLIELINRLHLAIIEHHGKATALEVLDRLSEHTDKHFMLEERLMRLSHFPELEAHKQQHQEMINQLHLLKHRFYNENKPIAFELLYVLKKWLLQHVNESDRRFGVHFVKARREQNADLKSEVDLAPKKNKWPAKFW